MTFRQGLRARGAAAICALLWLTAGGFAAAEDAREGDTFETDDAPAETDAAEDPGAPEGDESVADTAPSEPISQLSAIGVERLPAQGYPAPRVRGLYGGSMWLTMHGLQWPYMPADTPSTRIGFSGYGWVDTSYQKVDSGVPETDPSIREWRQQSRFVLRTTPTYNHGDGWFVQAQGEIVLNGAAPARTEDFLVADDLYVRAGLWNKFDVTAGRFQGWEIFHLGMGLDLNTVERVGAATTRRPVDLYGLTYFWDRPNGPGRLALHYYPSDVLRFELMAQVGASGLNVLAARPVGILDLGWLKVKLGAEYGKETPRQQSPDRRDKVESRGVAGTVQGVFDPRLELGFAFAHALLDRWNAQGVLDAAGSTTTTSYGGFANVRIIDPLLIGGAAYYTNEHNLKVNAITGDNDIRTHLQVFGAAQYAFWDQLFLKLVVAHANAHFNPLSDPPPIAEFRNKALSARVRLLYLF